MKKVIKKFARWVLSKEIKSSESHIKRLQEFCKPHLPAILTDGSDQTFNISINLDVLNGVLLPSGNITVNQPIVMHEYVTLCGKDQLE